MRGTRFCSEAVAMTHWGGEVKEADKSEKTLVAKYMLGPPAVREFFKQLIQSGMTLAQYDVHWRHKSGVPEGGIASRMHSTLTESLRWMITVDQVDPTELVAAECLTRELLRLEAAVNRDPRQTDWDGLEVMVSSCMNGCGSLETPAFCSWGALTQKDRAVMVRQSRLLHEEKVADSNRRKKDGKGGKEGEETTE